VKFRSLSARIPGISFCRCLQRGSPEGRENETNVCRFCTAFLRRLSVSKQSIVQPLRLPLRRGWSTCGEITVIPRFPFHILHLFLTSVRSTFAVCIMPRTRNLRGRPCFPCALLMLAIACARGITASRRSPFYADFRMSNIFARHFESSLERLPRSTCKAACN